jgi:hypothetical protein
MSARPVTRNDVLSALDGDDRALEQHDLETQVEQRQKALAGKSKRKEKKEEPLQRRRKKFR